MENQQNKVVVSAMAWSPSDIDRPALESETRDRLLALAVKAGRSKITMAANPTIVEFVDFEDGPQPPTGLTLFRWDAVAHD